MTIQVGSIQHPIRRLADLERRYVDLSGRIHDLTAIHRSQSAPDERVDIVADKPARAVAKGDIHATGMPATSGRHAGRSRSARHQRIFFAFVYKIVTHQVGCASIWSQRSVKAGMTVVVDDVAAMILLRR